MRRAVSQYVAVVVLIAAAFAAAAIVYEAASRATGGAGGPEPPEVAAASVDSMCSGDSCLYTALVRLACQGNYTVYPELLTLRLPGGAVAALNLSSTPNGTPPPPLQLPRSVYVRVSWGPASCGGGGTASLQLTVESSIKWRPGTWQFVVGYRNIARDGPVAEPLSVTLRVRGYGVDARVEAPLAQG